VDVVSAASVDLDALTELFNQAYADYVVPLRLESPALEYTLAVTDVDLEASRLTLAEGEPVAFAFLALRGGEGWIGGMGTLPAFRRRGLARAALAGALAEAGARGAASVRLEVIEQNAAARRLYEKLGFARERDLGVWTLDSAPPRVTEAQPAPLDEARDWIEANRRADEPWQRADETVEHMRGRGAALEALTVEQDGRIAGALIYQDGPGPPAALQLAAEDRRAAAHLLAALGARGDGFRFLNVPAGDPAAEALELLRARLQVRQHEMRIRI
jgi:GNAT superfamily N-acetyltransferase